MSSTKAHVRHIPQMEIAAHKSITALSPRTFSSGVKRALPSVAPGLPIAAEHPFSELRMLRGKLSAGSIKVVAFGPKFEKKKVQA